MRLPPDKVKEAILHADQDVREAAVYYFARSHSSDPAIMPLVIQAIEKFGFDNAGQTLAESADRLFVAKVGKGWRFVEVWNVSP
jgi:hypothetical protein